MKMASNKKMQENKLASKFNFTIERGEQFQNFHFDIMCVSWFVSVRGLIEDVWNKLNETRFSLWYKMHFKHRGSSAVVELL